jgi:hypothetical protein
LAEQETRQLQTPFLHATTAYDPNSLPAQSDSSVSPYKPRDDKGTLALLAVMTKLRLTLAL